jgi:IS30 family transposase
MVSKWIANNPFTIEERYKVKEAIDLKMSYREIGIYLGRSKSGVMRECKRLGKVEDYDPVLAQKDFEEKQKLIGIKKVNDVR